jgi:hypothetical protein
MNGLAARAHPFETAGPSARTVADGSMSPLAVARPSERLAIDQAEIAGIAWCGDIAEPSHEAIKEIRGRPLEPAFALTRGALGGDDVVALLPFGDHFQDDLGRVLQIRVDHDDRTARGVIEPDGDRDLMAEIARQLISQ